MQLFLPVVDDCLSELKLTRFDACKYGACLFTATRCNHHVLPATLAVLK